MLSARIPGVKNQTLIGGTLFILGLWSAYEIGGMVASGNMGTVELAGLGLAGCCAALAILRNWRAGFYFFLGWLLFEDLARKYMSNGIALFFGKDILAMVTYISLYTAIRKGKEETFRPPFLLPLAIFVWLGAAQIFNPNSPSILYGLLGFKVYFFYIPLIWVGYALIRNDEDLRKFLVVNAVVAIVIAAVGIIQAIVGNGFLNPQVLAPDLERLGNLDKATPSGQIFNLPDSIFVSTGRFANYLIVAFVLVLGTAGYLLLLRDWRGRKTVFVTIGALAAAALLSGARSSVVYMTASALVLVVAFVWGALKAPKQSRLLGKTIRRTVIVSALGLAAVLLIFPEQASVRLDFYTETLSPGSSSYEGTWRGVGYPLENLMDALTVPNWILGNGIGLASLGRQYVAEILKEPQPEIWVEEGFGVLIVEMGIIAPFLWLVWSAALIYCGWRVLRELRGTRFFPIGVAILWYAVLLLIFLTWAGFSIYQNYINNAYLWILIGILFRLPHILRNTPTTLPAVSAAPVTSDP
jgi:hypothetical protein